MGRSGVLLSDAVNAADFLRYFDAQLAVVRTSAADAPPPSFSSSPGCSLVEFRLLSVAEVVVAARKLLDKQCDSDAMPTCLLKDCADVLAQFLVDLFNRSLRTGTVPTAFKAAYVSPLLKKPGGESTPQTCSMSTWLVNLICSLGSSKLMVKT